MRALLRHTIATFAVALAATPALAQYRVGNSLVSRSSLEGSQGVVTILPYTFDPAALGGRVQSYQFVSNSAAQGEGGGDPIQITPLVFALVDGSYTVVGRGTTRELTYGDVAYGADKTFAFDFGLLPGGSDLVTTTTRVGYSAPYFQRGVVLTCDNGTDAPCDDAGAALAPFALSQAYGDADYPQAYVDSYNGNDLNAAAPGVGDVVPVARLADREYSIQFMANGPVGIVATPEPATVVLAGVGLAGVVLVRRRRTA